MNRKLKATGYLISNYCINQYRRIFGNGEHLIPICVTYFVTYRCNLFCRFCDDGHGSKYPECVNGELSTEAALELLEVMKRGVSGMYFTGGEPLLRGDIVQVIKRSNELGYCPIFLNTNGTLLHRKEECLTYIDWLIVSLGSLDETKYDELVGGRSGTTKLIKDTIIHYAKEQRKRNFILMVNCVILEETIEDVFGVMDFCAENNVYFCPVTSIRGVYPNWNLLKNPDYRRLVSRILEEKERGAKIYGYREYLETLLTFGRFTCYPTVAPHVDPGGYLLYPCPPLNGKGINRVKASSWSASYKEGQRIFGAIPDCDNRCHLSCYLSANMYLEHSLQSLRVLRTLIYR